MTEKRSRSQLDALIETMEQVAQGRDALDAERSAGAAEAGEAAETVREHRQDAARLRRVGRLLLDRLEEALARAGQAGEERELGPGDLKSLAHTHYEAAASLQRAVALERQALALDEGGEGAGGTITLPGLTILIDGQDADAG